jgi:hypothetical protein
VQQSRQLEIPKLRRLPPESELHACPIEVETNACISCQKNVGLASGRRQETCLRNGGVRRSENVRISTHTITYWPATNSRRSMVSTPVPANVVAAVHDRNRTSRVAERAPNSRLLAGKVAADQRSSSPFYTFEIGRRKPLSAFERDTSHRRRVAVRIGSVPMEQQR